MKYLSKKHIFFIVGILVVVFMTVYIVLNNRGVKDFSTEQHIARISSRIEKKYITGGTGYTDFNVYPLYNENEEVVYYMVEFTPKGFVYIEAYNLQSFLAIFIGGRTRYAMSFRDMCSYYNVDDSALSLEEAEKTMYHNGQCGVQNADGYNYCGISPFVLANVQNEHRYIFHVSDDIRFRQHYVLAVKQGEIFLNVLTQETFSYRSGQFNEKQMACAEIACGHQPAFELD